MFRRIFVLMLLLSACLTGIATELKSGNQLDLSCLVRPEKVDWCDGPAIKQFASQQLFAQNTLRPDSSHFCNGIPSPCAQSFGTGCVCSCYCNNDRSICQWMQMCPQQ